VRTSRVLRFYDLAAGELGVIRVEASIKELNVNGKKRKVPWVFLERDKSMWGVQKPYIGATLNTMREIIKWASKECKNG